LREALQRRGYRLGGGARGNARRPTGAK